MDAAEVDPKVRCVLVSVLGIFGEGFSSNAIERYWQTGAEGRERFRRGVNDAVGHGLLGVAAEGKAAGEHFVEDDAKRPDVGAPVGRVAFGLLGRHIGRGSERGTGFRNAGTVADL